ncbi:hypothetical protein ElyMa_001119500 [Elysia marginata]|uniref:Uncharacterized protein n=1 Tax=Elysia marginata TaxID=1093978 RepID=A0AAV4HWK9_9GAST|nr:hypothetical protein ElyMa_001119500 [Elysia marginata]
MCMNSFPEFLKLLLEAKRTRSAPWALAGTDAGRQADSLHRELLRNILRNRYLINISNASWYKRKCSEAPLSVHMPSARWRLFGHFVRKDTNISAK